MVVRMSFRRTAVVVTSVLLLATACSSEQSEKKPEPKDPSTRDAAALVQTSPLTGLQMKSGLPSNPVYVVKIENTSGGEPQLALDRADLVMEELVEGGLTRLAAFYYSDLPSKVGHVRSLRKTDVGIASPVDGHLVASGGAGGAVAAIKRAGVPLHSEDGGSPGFSSDPNLSRPYNRLINLQTLDKAAKGSGPKRPLLPWGEAGKLSDPGTSKVSSAKALTVRFSRSTATTWRLAGKAWVRTNGHAQKEFRASNLIVMFCKVGDAGYTDPAGNPVPTTEVEGSGRAVVLRGGKAVELTWAKKGLDSPISFKTADGKPYSLTPGKTFVELVPNGDGQVALR